VAGAEDVGRRAAAASERVLGQLERRPLAADATPDARTVSEEPELVGAGSPPGLVVGLELRRQRRPGPVGAVVVIELILGPGVEDAADPVQGPHVAGRGAGGGSEALEEIHLSGGRARRPGGAVEVEEALQGSGPDVSAADGEQVYDQRPAKVD